MGLLEQPAIWKEAVAPPSVFNRYYRKVANTGLVAALPLSRSAGPKQQP